MGEICAGLGIQRGTSRWRCHARLAHRVRQDASVHAATGEPRYQAPASINQHSEHIQCPTHLQAGPTFVIQLPLGAQFYLQHQDVPASSAYGISWPNYSGKYQIAFSSACSICLHLVFKFHRVYLSLQVTALKRAEAASGVSTRAGRPKALILGPTRELADQLLGVAKSLAHHDKFRAACLSGGKYSRSLVREKLSI